MTGPGKGTLATLLRDYIEARLGLARSLQGARRPDEALPHYQRVVEIDPRRVEAWIGRADILVGLERYEDARDWLARARQVHPEIPELASLHETVDAIAAMRRTLRR